MRKYEEVIKTIENSRRFESLPGVEITERALKQLGDPMKGLDYIHVAGTNGKGSVCAFLTSVFREAGLRTGTFTSPHLVDFEERIRVNGEKIKRADVVRLGNRLLETDFGVKLTMFDYCLLMAVLYFREKGCDAAVIETGLGGRLDSTNALGTPAVAAITRIGLDHTAILGDTLEAIAGEKAGIIKPGCPVVVDGQQSGEVLAVFKEKVRRTPESRLVVTTREDVELVSRLRLRMRGQYQLVNGAVALRTAELYLRRREKRDRGREPGRPGMGTSVNGDSVGGKRKPGQPDAGAPGNGDLIGDKRKTGRLDAGVSGNGYPVGQIRNQVQPEAGWPDVEGICCRGLEKAFWPGRMQLLSEHPFFMVDGAHNPQGVAALAESLKNGWPGERFHFIMGVMADKDYVHMIEPLLPLARDFVTVTPDNGRALQAGELSSLIRDRGMCAEYAETVGAALQNLPENGKTVAFGSLYFVGELLKIDFF